MKLSLPLPVLTSHLPAHSYLLACCCTRSKPHESGEQRAVLPASLSPSRPLIINPTLRHAGHEVRSHVLAIERASSKDARV